MGNDARLRDQLVTARARLVTTRAREQAARRAYFASPSGDTIARDAHATAERELASAELELQRVRTAAAIEGHWIARPDIYCVDRRPRYPA